MQQKKDRLWQIRRSSWVYRPISLLHFYRVLFYTKIVIRVRASHIECSAGNSVNLFATYKRFM